MNKDILIGAEGSFYRIPNEYLSKPVSEIERHIEIEGYVEKLLLVRAAILKPWYSEGNMKFAQSVSGTMMETMFKQGIADPIIWLCQKVEEILKSMELVQLNWLVASYSHQTIIYPPKNL